MIIIGSHAARFHLPDFRPNEGSDFDIIGTDFEFEKLVYQLTITHRSPITHDRGPTHKGIMAFNPRIKIDWLTPALASSQMIIDLDDHIDGELFGLPVKFASLETLTAIKAGHLYLDGQEKTEADLEALLNASQTLSEAHQAVSDTIRAEYLSRQG